MLLPSGVYIPTVLSGEPVQPVIVVDHLRKVYGATVAVDDVSLEILPGEIFGIIGPNGAGKTTTVECLQGLRDRDAGNVSVLGLDPAVQAQEIRHRIGSQLQESSLPDRMKVREALELFATFSERSVDPEMLIERWGLADRRNAAFGDLSGGQRQRLFIALAFINDPEIVFLDELTQGLDPQARRVTWGLIQEIRASGKTVVLVTHFMDEAETLCDRVAIIDRGRVVALDTPQRLISAQDLTTRVSFTSDRDVTFLSNVDGVRNVTRSGAQVHVDGAGPVLALAAAALVANGIIPEDLRSERATLEDVFIALTGANVRT
jgi:ABC-2 type transport system ATP-binding protein